MLRTTLYVSGLSAFGALALLTTACGTSGDEAGSGGTATTTTTTTGTGGSGQGGGGSGAGGQASMDAIGGDCGCTGAGCESFGVPLPNGGTGTITGCGDVPANIPGADLVCLRTYSGALANNTFFANGYCSLMATSCTGSPTICGSAVFGDYAAMTTCPAGTVMISDSRAVTVLGQNATVANKTCARACSAAGECRETETDPALAGAATQYQCIDDGGVKFCFDPRDLSANYAVQAF